MILYWRLHKHGAHIDAQKASRTNIQVRTAILIDAYEGRFQHQRRKHINCGRTSLAFPPFCTVSLTSFASLRLLSQSIFVFSMHVEFHVGLVTELDGRTGEEYEDDTGDGRCSTWIVAPFSRWFAGLGSCARSGRARRSLSVRAFRSLRRARRSVVLGLTGLEIVVES